MGNGVGAEDSLRVGRGYAGNQPILTCCLCFSRTAEKSNMDKKALRETHPREEDSAPTDAHGGE